MHDIAPHNNVCGIPRVARPPRASNALVEGTFGQGMRMKTPSKKKWRREVLESHLGLSHGPTSSRKNLHKPGHHPQLAKETFGSSPCTTYTLNTPTCCQLILPMSVLKRL